MALLSQVLDPATFELVRTAVLSLMVLAGGVIALAALPWRDDEIEDVDASARRAARALLQPGARRQPALFGAQARTLVTVTPPPPPSRATLGG